MLTLSLPRCLQMMIRIKQVSVKPYIKRPLWKGVSYKPPQLSSWRLFLKKTDVLVRWQMSHAHRRWPTARLSENSSMHAEIFFSGVKIYGLWNPNERQRGLFFWLLKPSSSSPDRLLEADACVVSSYRSQGWHLVGLCSHFVSAAWSCISIQPWGCAASWEGSVCGRGELLEHPGRSSCGEKGRAATSVDGLRFEGQQACHRGVVQSCNSVGFIEDLFSSVCCSIKLREEKFWTASSSLVDLLILTQ